MSLIRILVWLCFVFYIGLFTEPEEIKLRHLLIIQAIMLIQMNIASDEIREEIRKINKS